MSTSHPTAAAYQDAMQHPGENLIPVGLREAKTESAVFGLPRVVRGRFSAVFPVRLGGERRGLKCFTAARPDRKAHYAQIRRYIEAERPDWAVCVDYHERGIRVDGSVWPLLDMEWVEGRTLRQFVEDHRGDAASLRRLADRWRELMGALEGEGVSHGDLQHGNVFVQTEGDRLTLKLVDYDEMVVPGVEAGERQAIGHRNYQHPEANASSPPDRADRFPALVIWTALHALAADPGRWSRYDRGENLLFTEADFFTPDDSALLSELLEDEAVASYARMLRRIALAPVEGVPSLEEFVSGQVEGLPSPNARRRSRRGTPPEGELLPRSAPAIFFVLLALIWAVGWGAPLLALAGTAVVMAGGAVYAWNAWRWRPDVRRSRRLAAYDRFLKAEIVRSRREIEEEERRIAEEEDHLASVRQRRLEAMREDTLQEQLRHHFVAEAAERPGLSHKVVVRLKLANIRTAGDLTERQLERTTGLSRASKTRLLAWRDELEVEYESSLPEQLTGAQERQFRRTMERKREEARREVERLEERISVRRVEREEVAEKMSRLDPPALRSYLRQLVSFSREAPGTSK